VALNRIAVYLDEDEVTEQVSSLKQDFSEPATTTAKDEGLGLENASFQWNKVEETAADSSQPAKVPESSLSSSASSLVEVRTVVGTDESQDHHFELKDVSVIFPEGQLSVITGPTARYVFLHSFR
jgi:hypothetical protein